MSAELTVALSVRDNIRDLERVLASKGIDVAGSRFIHHEQLIGLTEEALQLGELASLGVCWFKNWDATNYVEIRKATGASNDCWKLLPGEEWAWRFGSDVSAPFAIANSAVCYVEYVIWEI